ncbi:unnamed protein product [Anisakis simplex]|uniref:tRNA:m(4)X modification enzyme TRM13 n=1 Tax=Anisakis simplex TaxID=6269 RepID=A0A0M3K9P4_ANISI|nr:unnamed protein product [Anisakis simplex]
MSGEELLRCNYMLPTKKRRCRMLVKKGNLFCGEHSIHDPSKSERVICPNDPKHTVKKDELEKHLATKCNSRLPDEPWIVFNINVANQDRGKTLFVFTDRVDECDNRRPDDEQLSRMSALIQNAIQKVSFCITDRVLTSKQITDHLSSNTHLSGEHRKHLIQLSSIIGYFYLR